MKQSIYKNWKDDLSKRFWISERFEQKSYDEMVYSSVLKTMRYIASNIYFVDQDFKKELKQDLKEVRDYYLSTNTGFL
jgi:hypothetical protein